MPRFTIRRNKNPHKLNVFFLDQNRRNFTPLHRRTYRLCGTIIIPSQTYNSILHFFFITGETRVMIFSQYRDSVSEITNILRQHHPLIKVMSFIGQSSAGKATKGFTQKEQLKVINKTTVKST